MNTSKKEKRRHIPLKNYLYLSLSIFATILVLFYVYKWYETYKQSKLNTGIMNDYLTVIHYNELDNYITENKNAIIYVSVLGDTKINKFESSFKNMVMKNELRNILLYLDITNEDKEMVFSKLGIDNNLPYIVVYTNGEITDTYSILQNDYNTKKVEKYLNRIGAIESD